MEGILGLSEVLISSKTYDIKELKLEKMFQWYFEQEADKRMNKQSIFYWFFIQRGDDQNKTLGNCAV